MSRQLSLQLNPIMNPGGSGFPVKRGTWNFLEAAYNTGISETIISLIGNTYDPSIVYIITGCNYRINFGNINISAGLLFYNGEYFTYDGSSVFPVPTGGDVAVANLISTSFNPIDANGNFYADPVVFQGVGGTANVHIDRTVTFSSGASGSGTLTEDSNSDFPNIVNIAGWTIIDPSLINAGWQSDPSAPARYYVDTHGKIHFNGNLVTTSTSPNNPILSLGLSFLNLPLLNDNFPLICTVSGSFVPLSFAIDSIGNLSFLNGGDVPTTIGYAVYLGGYN